MIQAQVFDQESRRERMAVAGGDVRAAPVADEARQRQPAADFEDPFADEHGTQRQTRGEMRAGWPQHAEQRPHRR